MGVVWGEALNLVGKYPELDPLGVWVWVGEVDYKLRENMIIY